MNPIETYLYLGLSGLSVFSLLIIIMVKKSINNDLYKQHPAPLFTRIAYVEISAAYHMALQVTPAMGFLDMRLQRILNKLF